VSWVEALRFQVEDLAIGTWETRHSLFVHFTLYGALFVAIAVAAAPLPARARSWLVVGLSIASLGVLGSFGGTLFALAFSVALWLAVESIPGRAGALIAAVLLVALVVYPALVPAELLRGNPHHMREFWAFATNVWLLRCIAYVVDRRARGRPTRTLREFLLATLFFPTFVNGPIETTEQLAAHTVAGPSVRTWDELRAYGRDALTAIGRMLLGIAKVLIATFYLGQENETIFATGGTGVSHPRLWLWMIELYFLFYVVFSGWTDVSVGLARLMGFRIMENFDRPWRSRSVAEFWRRWHISFGVWLRDYVYVPLGGNRRHAALNVMATFLLSGLWHVWGALKVLGPEAYPPRAWLGFVTWGAMNGAAVVAGRWWSRTHTLAPLRSTLESKLSATTRARGSQAFAFAFIALAWVPFFLPPWIDVSMCWDIFLRLLYVK
jgi:D-alanyl-lipoteichoic acid acyltransferase DltB (MBOAT superfamily)